MKRSRFQQGVGLVVAVIICFAAAGLGSLATSPNISTWYADYSYPTWPGSALPRY